MNTIAIAVIGCVCSVIGTILTMAVTVGKPLINNTKTMTELIMTINNLTHHLDTLEIDNHSEHNRIHDRIDEVEEKVNEHSISIAVLQKNDA